MVSAISGSGGMSSYVSQMREKVFQTLDTSGDGKIGKDEITAALGSGSDSKAGNLISQLDSDGDGGISELEFEAGLSKLSQDMKSRRAEGKEQELFSKIDTNGDGSVSKEEFISNRPEEMTEEQATSSWSKLDTDNTGSLTEDQFASAMKTQGSPPGPPPEGIDGSDSGSAKLAGSTDSSKASSRLSELFSKIDTNGDGSVSKEEFISNRPEEMTEEQATSLWSKLDTDNTGGLTESQFSSAMEAQRPHHGHHAGPPPTAAAGTSDSSTATSSTSSTDSSDSTQSTASTEDSINDTLTQLLNAAVQSYLKNSGTFFIQNFAASGMTSAYA